jgi:uncharacterized protein (DUF433 family)
MMVVSTARAEPWRRRLYIPNYQIGEAARYARVSPKTVAEWHKAGTARQTLSHREKRAELSYMQLIELAVVAAFRKAGIPLKGIRATREYVSNEFQSEFPFAEYRFKSDGKRLLMDYQQVAGAKGRGKLLRPDQGGQLAWEEILGRLQEFEYERRGIVVRWHLAGPNSLIVIDPRIAFGAPAVRGTPTWIVKSRWQAGESVDDISDDFGLKEETTLEALKFEGVDVGAHKWTH